jgi:hypothetical protein
VPPYNYVTANLYTGGKPRLELVIRDGTNFGNDGRIVVTATAEDSAEFQREAQNLARGSFSVGVTATVVTEKWKLTQETHAKSLDTMQRSLATLDAKGTLKQATTLKIDIVDEVVRIHLFGGCVAFSTRVDGQQKKFVALAKKISEADPSSEECVFQSIAPPMRAFRFTGDGTMKSTWNGFVAAIPGATPRQIIESMDLLVAVNSSNMCKRDIGAMVPVDHAVATIMTHSEKGCSGRRCHLDSPVDELGVEAPDSASIFAVSLSREDGEEDLELELVESFVPLIPCKCSNFEETAAMTVPWSE